MRSGRGARLLPRTLHPGAWWLWALGLATAASRTTNPLLLGLVLAVAGFVVMSRRSDAPWARAYGFYLAMGLVVIAIRVVFGALFGAPLPGRVLVTLPEVGLPEWAAGVRLGGEVTLEGVLAAVYEGLQLATMLACIGAANALANPKRLLKAMPGALYEVGVAVVVALSFSPQLVEAVGRVRAARRLRGRPDRGLRGLRGVAMPVLEDALERSVELAAAMDSRGFGRTAADRSGRRTSGVLTLGGLLGVCVGAYGLLDAQSPAALGLPVLGAGLLTAVAGLVVGGRRAVRSRYRPDPWSLPEWLVAGSGAVAAVAVVVTSALDPAGTAPSTSPLVLPTLPLLATLGLLAATLPARAAPVPPRSAPPPRAGTSDTVPDPGTADRVDARARRLEEVS
jgi:energy-coupling factor transport system permease protein